MQLNGSGLDRQISRTSVLMSAIAWAGHKGVARELPPRARVVTIFLTNGALQALCQEPVSVQHPTQEAVTQNYTDFLVFLLFGVILDLVQ
jgi:sRNA-binding regulator protein Hfq